MSKKVIAAGHICLDITPVFEKNNIPDVNNFLKPGKLIELDNVHVSTGGSVANTGLAMKLLGADVSLMGKVGKDAFGDMICNLLSKYDADKGMIRSDGETSSYSVVLALPNVDRMFLHCPGTNSTYKADDINADDLKDVALFHFGYPPLMKELYINDGEGMVEIFKKAKNAGAATSLDLAAVDPSSEAGKVDWYKILERIIPLTDFFVPSIEELCYMLDKERYKSWQTRANGKDITEVLDIEKDIKPLADKCMELGAKVLLLKCGKPGLYYRTADKTKLDEISKRLEIDTEAWSNKEGFEKSFKPEKVLSATAAGDTSIAGFLTGMLNGETIEKAVELASALGTLCVEKYDALSGIKDLTSVKKRIEAGWAKND